MMEIAFSGIENSKLFKGAHPQKIPRKNGTKSPLLIHLVTLFNLLATSIFIETPDVFFPATLPKEKYAHWYQYKLVKVSLSPYSPFGFFTSFLLTAW